MSKEHCLICPNSDQPSTDKNVSVFLMAVVNVPGKTPYIATSEKVCKELPDGASDCQVCDTVASLMAEGVVKRAVDVAEEIRKNFMPKEAPCQTSLQRPTPSEPAPSGSPTSSSDCPKPTDCGNCGN
jgi:hypothetical protein